MGRARLKRSEVVEKATALFWRHGYRGTSMQMLTEATGLKPGSLYLAFGSKEGLFVEVLDAYAEASRARALATITSAPTVGEGLCEVLAAIVTASAASDYCSCLLIKTQLELGDERGPPFERARAQLAANEAQYRELLEREGPPDVARRRAASFMLHVFGTRVFGYGDHRRDDLWTALEAGLPWLPWGEGTRRSSHSF